MIVNILINTYKKLNNEVKLPSVDYYAKMISEKRKGVEYARFSD